MLILVSDTSVLIDLERGALLESAFRLPCEFAVPDLLYRRELRDQNGPVLVSMGLRVEELTPEGVTLAQTYRGRKLALSLPDAFALALAKTRDFTLLTGDQGLRSLAIEETVECHGVLWLLDKMNHEGAATQSALLVGLQKITAHPRCRLPKEDVERRLVQYRVDKKTTGKKT